MMTRLIIIMAYNSEDDNKAQNIVQQEESDTEY